MYVFNTLDRKCQFIVTVLRSFCKSMIDYVAKTEQNDIKFTIFLLFDHNCNDINDNDMCKWNHIWRSLFGYDILSMIRNMFTYTVLFGKTFDDNYNNKIGCIDVTFESLTYQNRVQPIHLHILNSKIIDFLSYYIDLHHFEKIKLSDRVTLQFISDLNHDQLHCDDDHLLNSNMKGDCINQQYISTNTMSFSTIVNAAANTNSLPYWSYHKYTRMLFSLIPQCLSTVRIKNFRYNNKCSLYSGNYNITDTNGNGNENDGSTRNLKFFNLCSAFQCFDKIEICDRSYQIRNLHAMNWIRNVCNEKPRSDKSKSNYKRKWIVFKTKNNNGVNQNSYYNRYGWYDKPNRTITQN